MQMRECTHMPDALPPAPAPLPSLPTAFNRRAALFGAVTATGFLGAAGTAALGQGVGIMPIPSIGPADARLLTLADTIATHFRAVESYAEARINTSWRPEKDPAWDAAISAYGPWEEEMAETPAASMVGVMAKARAMQVPTTRHCSCGIAESMADDLVRIVGGARV